MARLVSLAPLLLVPATAFAQSVRGVVVDQANAPRSGVVVQLIDSTSTVVGTTLTDARGAFRIMARAAGTYRLRSLRIGYRPALSDPIVLSRTAETAVQLPLNALPVSLDAMRVSATTVCRDLGDSTAAANLAWEQARTAIAAVQATAAVRPLFATAIDYEKTLNAAGTRVVQQALRSNAAYVRQPWAEVDQDSLHRAGYVLTDHDGATVYHAPGFQMLLSSVFVQDHCFRAFDDGALIGISFTPTEERRQISEIRGTIWLDRATAVLRRLEFGYSNVGRQQQAHAGGSMDFVRLDDGSWVISAWEIRMPVLERESGPLVTGGSETRVTGIRVNGGTLYQARRGPDTLWSRSAPSFAAVLIDSASGRAVPNAQVRLAGTGREFVSDSEGRFTMANVIPGEYALEVRTASFDSASAAFRAAVTLVDSLATVAVRVPDATRARAAVAATFAGNVVDSMQRPISGVEVTLPQISRTVSTDESGAFRMTNIPPGGQRVLVRRIGYGPLDTVLAFASGRTTQRHVTLTRSTQLDSVMVTAAAIDRVMSKFEENRRVGLGHFFSRDELAQREGRSTAAVLSEVTGMRIAFGKGGRAWIRGGRNNQSLSGTTSPDPVDAALGAPAAMCYAMVYLDGMLMFGNRKLLNRFEPLFDVNSIRPDQIEAIEYYAGPAQTPAEYSKLDSTCGVLVIHTRRPRSEKP